MSPLPAEASRESLVLTVPGEPPSASMPADAEGKALMEEAVKTLRDLARETSCCPPTRDAVALAIRHIRKASRADAADIMRGVADALQGVLYEHAIQIHEASYSERPGEREHYQVFVAPPGLQIPLLLEPQGEIGIFKADPTKFFPDDPASRWMLSLLLANEDIGVTLKLVSTYLMSPRVSIEPHAQYRTSHMLYFWRLWLAHIHEAWCGFNKAVDHGVVRRVKAAEDVEQARRKIAELRGRKIVGELTASDLLEKCRHVTFHYSEQDGDKWPEQLKSLGPDFHVCITHGDSKDVDSRWLIADEYTLSRLNPFEFGNRSMHEAMRDIAMDTISLVRLCQKHYFNERQPGFLK